MNITFAILPIRLAGLPKRGRKSRLASMTNRCIGLEWWPEPLALGAEHVYVLAVGMAEGG